MECNKQFKAISFRLPIARYEEAEKLAERCGLAPGVLARVALFEFLVKSNKSEKADERRCDLDGNT